MSIDEPPAAKMLSGYWSLSYRTSNHISVSIDALGAISFRLGIGDDGITMPLEDLEMILTAFHGKTR